MPRAQGTVILQAARTAALGLPLLLALPELLATAEDGAAGLALDDECVADGEAGAEACALNALQLRRTAHRGVAATAATFVVAEEDCHDMQEGDVGACMNSINWAKREGYPKHPGWYAGLDAATASLADWQFFAWNTTHPTCPRPCTSKAKAVFETKWCDSLEAPELWRPNWSESPVKIKILSYNLFWWNLFRIRGGLSAARLIRETSEDQPYDVMGFQECEDPEKVLGPAGLDADYEIYNSSKATCMAFRNSTWKLLDRGEDEVAMDMKTEYYGHRSAQWMRLQHIQTGQKLLFVNHHGPLSVNSGGSCGGKATAYNLLKVMAKHGKKGDALVLVGDFNANAASMTVQGLWPHLTHVFNGKSFGGVDNIFSNLPKAAIVETNELGSGGSDHHAISATLELPPGNADVASVPQRAIVAAAAARAEPDSSVGALETSKGSDSCLLEPKIMYTFAPGGWSKRQYNVVDPRICCDLCEGHDECAAWTWEEWSDGAKGPLCVLRSSDPVASQTVPFAVSGLPKAASVRAALANAPMKR